MYLDWPFALAWLPILIVTVGCYALGDKLGEWFPRSHAAKVASSLLRGVGAVGAGLVVLVIVLAMFGPVVATVYCALMVCDQAGVPTPQ